MKLLCLFGCLLGTWLCLCHGLPQTHQAQENQGNDCEVYRTQHAPPHPTMQFRQRTSMGLMPQGTALTAQLVLESKSKDKKCQLFLMSGTITPDCGSDSISPQILGDGNFTELWMELVENSRDASTPVWDLKVLGRRGKKRVHILIPKTGLQPPLNMWLESQANIHYYYNCVTGCLFDKSVTMAQGDNTFFLRNDETFEQMNIDSGQEKLSRLADVSLDPDSTLTRDLLPLPEDNHPNLRGLVDETSYGARKHSINVTADELPSFVGLSEVTVVWDKQLGKIGVLVNGAPLGNLTDYEALDKKRQVKVTVSEEGGGLVAPCDPLFQMMAWSDAEEVTIPTTEPSTTTTTTTTTSSQAPAKDETTTHHQTNQQETSGWLPAVFTFVLLNFIVTVAAITLAAFLYWRSSSNTCGIGKEPSSPPAFFSRKLSTRSSIRSSHRESQRRKTKNDAIQEDKTDSRNEDVFANSETVNTPLTTPDSEVTSRRPRNLSTDEFVDLSLM